MIAEINEAQRPPPRHQWHTAVPSIGDVLQTQDVEISMPGDNKLEARQVTYGSDLSPTEVVNDRPARSSTRGCGPRGRRDASRRSIKSCGMPSPRVSTPPTCLEPRRKADDLSRLQRCIQEIESATGLELSVAHFALDIDSRGDGQGDCIREGNRQSRGRASRSASHPVPVAGSTRLRSEHGRFCSGARQDRPGRPDQIPRPGSILAGNNTVASGRAARRWSKSAGANPSDMFAFSAIPLVVWWHSKLRRGCWKHGGFHQVPGDSRYSDYQRGPRLPGDASPNVAAAPRQS